MSLVYFRPGIVKRKAICMNRLQLMSYVRGLLGRGYSVADEEGALDGRLRLVIVRRGKDEVLTVEMADSWIQHLSLMPTPEERMLLKHLGICVKRYFAHPDALDEPSFRWPGTAENRSEIRLALDPRRRRRSSS
jgi:hypothetical protein